MTTLNDSTAKEPVTMEFMAGVGFQPEKTMKDVEKEENFLRERQEEIGVGRRLAYILTTKTKAEMVEMVNKDPDTAMDMLDRVSNILDVYKIIVDVMESAEVRLLSASAAVAEAEQIELEEKL
ncbi:MAG: hypothetical protein COB23_07205 [Methylophaga sp.]|nr:MAG: hypothetical protein COB23_07205 [Methylophaga sp.]